MTSETETDISRTEDPLILALLITVAQEVCTAMCASEVVISGLDWQGLRCLAGTGEAPRASACLQHDSRFSADCLKAGEVVFLKDADGDLGTPLSTAGSVPVLAMAVPILAKGSVVGALEIFFTTHSAICAADIAPLEKIADFLGPILARSVYAQPMTDGSTLGAIQTQTSLPTEIQTRGQPSGTPTNNTEELVDPLSVAVAPRPRASSPASQIESPAAQKSWQAVPGPNVAAVQEEATSSTAQGTETGSPPEFTLGPARASKNTIEPDQASTRNNKETLISAVAAVFLVLAAGSASYLRITSSPARSKLTAAVSQPHASVVVSQSLPQDGTARRATFPGEVTLASPTVTTAHTNTESAAASTQPVSVLAVLPGYPLLAKNQHLEGDVRVDAVIDVNGRVTATKAVSGPVLLQQAAVDALRQWKYRPATLNGKPVPMHLSVTIRFRAR
jgi:TonB family protein